MHRMLIAIAILMAVVGLAPASPASAASTFCNATAYQPVDAGTYVSASGRGSCSGGVWLSQQQVCLYRNGVAITCRTWYPGQSSFTGSVGWTQVNNGSYATYQTYTWIYDSQGQSEGAWSATAYLGV